MQSVQLEEERKSCKYQRNKCMIQTMWKKVQIFHFATVLSVDKAMLLSLMTTFKDPKVIFITDHSYNGSDNTCRQNITY